MERHDAISAEYPGGNVHDVGIGLRVALAVRRLCVEYCPVYLSHTGG